MNLRICLATGVTLCSPAHSQSRPDDSIQQLRAAVDKNPGDAGAQASLIRALLRGNSFREALDAGAKADRLIANDSTIKALVGEALYHQAEFDKAYAFFLAGIGNDPKCARCFLGAGRIHRTAFRRKSARAAFRKAYELDPLDPDIKVAYATTKAYDEAKAGLLEEYLLSEPNAVSSGLDPHKKAPRKSTELVSRDQSYRIRVNIMRHRADVSNGMYVTASFNGARPVKLQLDTGASGFLLNPRAANAAGLKPLSTFQAFGLGDDGGRTAHVGIADRFKIGDLEFANVPVDFSERKLLEDCDGLIGVDVFSRFLIRLNIPGETMELTPLAPYPDGSDD